jgi:uncharacterized membrane protein YfcA
MTITLFVVSFLAGLLGSLSGLGGGVVIVPLLVYGFGVDILHAVGASLVAVVATSLTTTANLLERGYTHLRLCFFLETAAVPGAIFGAKIAPFVPTHWIALLFALVLFYVAFIGFRGPPRPIKIKNNTAPAWLNLSYTFLGKKEEVHRLRRGWLLMGFGGVLSGLLGIGSGSINVLILERLMGLPLAVATATSSAMIGMMASAGGWTYWERNLIDPDLIFPLFPGVFLGAWLGTYLISRLPTKAIRVVFSTLVLVMGIRMFVGSVFS